jgi:hypothetical protein
MTVLMLAVAYLSVAGWLTLLDRHQPGQLDGRPIWWLWWAPRWAWKGVVR